MCKVRRSFDPVRVVYHPASSDLSVEYRKKYDENGNSVYIKVREFSLSEQINSYENTCSLQAMLQRVSLMPLTDKVKILQQVPRVGCDTTMFPKDLTDAMIKMQNLKTQHPELTKRIMNGESVDDIIKSMFKTKEESEVIENGKDKPSND